ncbi:UvrABC system protein C [Clostridia bacterium]|nr:UvrABC system protein C [Clostridia bacterium]
MFMNDSKNTVSNSTADTIPERIQSLRKRASSLPNLPGVYLMKNTSGKIIYVGKAKMLANRVPQYFAVYPHPDIKTERLVENIFTFDFIVTKSDVEALIEENQLIKLHSPKYNIKLKDGKNYPYLRISTGEEYPTLTVTRSRGKDDKAEFFGPFSNKGSIYTLIDEIKSHFMLPSCPNIFPRDIGKKRPCLNYRIKRCMGVCTGKISAEQYRETITAATRFIKGDYAVMLRELSAAMETEAENLNFEAAASLRDRIASIEKLRAKQRIIAAPDVNADVFGVYDGGTNFTITVLSVRFGVVADKHTENFGAETAIGEEWLLQFMQNYYVSRDVIPPFIVISENASEDGRSVLENYLAEKAGRKVKIHTPKFGGYKELANAAVTNAAEDGKLYRQKFAEDSDKLMLVAKTLGLEVVPHRIEAYDVSNSGDDFITCGMIVLEDGTFLKKAYRSFNIKGISGQDDYAAMSEAVRRRFARLEESTIFAETPDLILLDGGANHVSVIKSELEKIGSNAAAIPLFGMVKDEFHKTRTLTDGVNEINIAKEQTVFVFFYKIQEEVHRFSIKRMDVNRRKAVKTSELQQIKGLGLVKIKALYDNFKSIIAISEAKYDEIVSVKGITNADADRIIQYFQMKRIEKK